MNHYEVLINELKVLKSLRLSGRKLDIGVGIDPSLEMLKIAKMKMEAIRAVRENFHSNHPPSTTSS